MGLISHVQNLKPSTLVAIGLILFLFPEPATSVLGIGMVLLGASWWFDVWGDASETAD